MIVVLDSGIWISALQFGAARLVALQKALTRQEAVKKMNRYQQFKARALRRAGVRRAYEEGLQYMRQEIEEKIARGLSQLDRSEAMDGDEAVEKLGLRGQGLRRQRR